MPVLSPTNLEKLRWSTQSWSKIMSDNMQKLEDTLLYIDEMFDVNLSALADGDVLQWDEGTSKWVNVNWKTVFPSTTSTTTTTVSTTTSTTNTFTTTTSTTTTVTTTTVSTSTSTTTTTTATTTTTSTSTTSTTTTISTTTSTTTTVTTTTSTTTSTTTTSTSTSTTTTSTVTTTTSTSTTTTTTTSTTTSTSTSTTTTTTTTSTSTTTTTQTTVTTTTTIVLQAACGWDPNSNSNSAQFTVSHGGYRFNLLSGWNALRSLQEVVKGASGYDKFYLEFLIVNIEAGGRFILGIGNESHTTENTYVGSLASGWGYYSLNGSKINNNSFAAYGNSYTEGDVIGVAFNLTTKKVWFRKNGTWQNSGDPVTEANPAYSNLDQGNGMYAMGSMDDAGLKVDMLLHENDWQDAAPTGFVSMLCSAITSTTTTTSTTSTTTTTTTI